MTSSVGLEARDGYLRRAITDQAAPGARARYRKIILLLYANRARLVAVGRMRVVPVRPAAERARDARRSPPRPAPS
jgi:hypothetical protein